MNNWKKIFWNMLFPQAILIFVFVNLSAVLLAYVFCEESCPETVAYISYVMSAYTLTVVCARMPRIVKTIKKCLYNNKYANKYLTERELRIRISLYGGLGLNICFAVFKIVMGVLYKSKWLFAMAGYNTILSVMRFILVYRDRTDVNIESKEEKRTRGLHSYKVCGWLMLLLNSAISVIVFIVVFENQAIEYPGFMIYAIAAYSFYCMTMAIINMAKYWHRHNPVFSGVKRIEMAKALVSIFTLQVAMFTQFGDGERVDFQMANMATGLAVCIIITSMAVLMIFGAKKDYKKLEINNSQI